MKEYVIITDSTADLQKDIAQSMGIKVIPMEYTIDGALKTYCSTDSSFDDKEFYDMLKKGAKCSTSQITVSTYLDFFKKYLDEGLDILYICFSSALSGTYNSSILAKKELEAEYPDRKIITIDSKAAAMGQGLLTYKVAKLKKEENFSIEDGENWAQSNMDRICHWFTVDDLHHLARGGRMSSMKATIGSTLSIKPVLHVNSEGKLIPVKNVRGRKKSIKSLFEIMQERMVLEENNEIFICHAQAYEEAKMLGDMIKAEYGIEKIHISPIGPIIGTHLGPGAITLFFVGNEK
mgnify:CR=1 FL=1